MPRSEQVHRGAVLLVYYSHDSRRSLERAILGQDLEVVAIDGRAPESADLVPPPGTALVVVDRGASDINVGQAVRQLGRLLPWSHIIVAYPNRPSVEVFHGGHRIAYLPSLEAAILEYGREDIAKHRRDDDQLLQ